FQFSAAYAHLHPFPTRRSSDLQDGRPSKPAASVHIPGNSAFGDGMVYFFGIFGPHGTDRHPAAKVSGKVNFFGGLPDAAQWAVRSEEHTSELQSRENLVCRLLL